MSQSTNDEIPFQELYFKTQEILIQQDIEMEVKNMHVELLSQELHDTRLKLLNTQTQLLRMSTEVCNNLNSNMDNLCQTQQQQPRGFISFQPRNKLNCHPIYFML